MVICDQLLYCIGASTGHNAGIKVGCVHIDDAAVGVTQIVHQGGIGLAGGDGQSLTLCLHIHNFGIAGSAVVVFQQVLQALLHGFAIHIPAGGELHAIPEGNCPGAVAVIGPVRCQPGLQLHGIRVVDQSLANAIADAGPAIVGPVGVHSLLPVFGIKGGVADDHGFLRSRGRSLLRTTAICGRIRCVAAAARQQKKRQAGNQQKGYVLIHFYSFLSWLFYVLPDVTASHQNYITKCCQSGVSYSRFSVRGSPRPVSLLPQFPHGT